MSAAESWLERYKEAWETRDPHAAAALFAPAALYHETPFDEPKRGPGGVREYWAGVTADQRDVAFRYELLAVSGSTAVAHWNAQFRLVTSGARVELDGVFVLGFDAQGLCISLREWWHARQPETPP
jgi:hypothetical protein